MSYKVIFEIGPVTDFIKSSRKLRDLWGASFYISYLMARTIKFILEEEITGFDYEKNKDKIKKIISRPFLQDDPLLQFFFHSSEKSERNSVGSIPDKIYCILEKKETPQKVLKKFYCSLLKDFNEIAKCLITERELGIDIADYQLTKYFRLFYVTSPTDDFNVLETAINVRGEIFEFDNFLDRNNSVDRKEEKCSLCGDRKKVISLDNSRRRNRKEHFCAVCAIKRGFLKYYIGENSKNQFVSTTDIAAFILKTALYQEYNYFDKVIKKVANEIIKSEPDEGLDDLDNVRIKLLKKAMDDNPPETIEYLPYEQYYADQQVQYIQELKREINKVFIEKRQSEALKNLYKQFNLSLESYNLKTWLQHSFYSIIALDGDDFTSVLQNARKDNKEQDLSAGIINFSHECQKTINNYGKLIFCGGEDILAIIHPVFIFKLLEELDDSFQRNLNKIQQIPTLSAGAVICHHKYPLALAIEQAHKMLDDVAKNQPGKASCAIRLIKGNSKGRDFIFKIRSINGNNNDKEYTINDFEELVQAKEVPKGFVYKLEEDREILNKVLTNNDEIKKYFNFAYTKGDNSIVFTPELEKLVEKTVNKNQKTNIDLIIDRLYFARFLKGEES